jgi:hypothetical protein
VGHGRLCQTRDDLLLRAIEREHGFAERVRLNVEWAPVEDVRAALIGSARERKGMKSKIWMHMSMSTENEVAASGLHGHK